MPYAYIKIVTPQKEDAVKILTFPQRAQGPQEQLEPLEKPRDIGADNNIFKKSVFDTKNYYFYYTEIRKEDYRPMC